MTNKIFRSTIALTIAIYTLGHTIATVNGDETCTMDNMRVYAADACEILMRHIRSVDEGIVDLPYHIIGSNDLNEPQLSHTHHHHSHHKKRRVPIRRNEFPNDGYLLVDHDLSKYLVRQNLDPFSYNTVNANSRNSNDEPEEVHFVEYDREVRYNHHSHKHRARQHPRFRRQHDEKHVEFCCQFPENCSIAMC